jgi:hypothetical protein
MLALFPSAVETVIGSVSKRAAGKDLASILMTKEEFERRWNELSASRDAIYRDLVGSGAIPVVNLKQLGVARSSNTLIVGSDVEHSRPQRGNIRFSAPEARTKNELS